MKCGCEREKMSEVPVQSSVFGLPVYLLKDYPHWLMSRLRQGVGTHVVTLNSEMVMQAEETPALDQAIRQAELVIPDGAGVVFYLKFFGQNVNRCPGIELSEALLKLAGEAGQDCPVFFIGGKPGVAQTAADNWQHKSPGLTMVGVQHGYLTPEDEAQLCQTLQQKQPRLIFVGLGVPRQEFWIIQHRHLCPNATWIGVGGSFDVWAGIKERAPVWMQKLNLEWLYRLYQEPWRWRRMLVLPQFAWRTVLAASFKRSAMNQ